MKSSPPQPPPSPEPFRFANGRQAKIGDTVVNSLTGQKTVITSLHPKSAFYAARKYYTHVSDLPKNHE